jgi:dolichol-phosphate mannosyltransferase
VVIPAYNEAKSIAEVASRASAHADVCVVDDASTDGTGEIAARLPRVHVIRHARNTHIAGGILDGFRYGLEKGYDFCVTMDAGLSHLSRSLFPSSRLRDCTSGYRMYSRAACEAVTSARLRSRAFDFHIEALACVHRAGLRIAEVPIRYRFTNSSLRWSIVLEALRTWAGILRQKPA